jgi:hypothetical protein
VEWAYTPPARISAATQTASMICSSVAPFRRASRVCPGWLVRLAAETCGARGSIAGGGEVPFFGAQVCIELLEQVARERAYLRLVGLPHPQDGFFGPFTIPCGLVCTLDPASFEAVTWHR